MLAERQSEVRRYNAVFFPSHRQLIVGQPAKVQVYVLTASPAQKPKETDPKQAECVSSGGAAIGTVDKPELESPLPAGDQKEISTGTSVIQASSEGDSKTSVLPALPSSCTPDLCDEISESRDEEDQCPDSVSAAESATVDQQPQSD